MKVYLVYECYFKDDGKFIKILRKVLKDRDRALAMVEDFPVTLLQWMEIEQRDLE